MGRHFEGFGGTTAKGMDRTDVPFTHVRQQTTDRNLLWRDSNIDLLSHQFSVS